MHPVKTFLYVHFLARKNRDFHKPLLNLSYLLKILCF